MGRRSTWSLGGSRTCLTTHSARLPIDGKWLPIKLVIEILKLLVELAGSLAWPFVVLVLVIKFSPAIHTIIKSITSHLSPSRNIRARIGSFELESNEVPIKREELKQIAVEPDPAKRLELFKEKFDLEKALGSLEEQDVEWLALVC